MSETCENLRWHYAPYEWDDFTCSVCGCTVDRIGDVWPVKIPFGDTVDTVCVKFCPQCGRKVVSA